MRRAPHKLPDPAPARRGAGGFIDGSRRRQQAPAIHGFKQCQSLECRRRYRQRGLIPEILSRLDDRANVRLVIVASVATTMIAADARRLIAAFQTCQLTMHREWQPDGRQPQGQQSSDKCHGAKAMTDRCPRKSNFHGFSNRAVIGIDAACAAAMLAAR